MRFGPFHRATLRAHGCFLSSTPLPCQWQQSWVSHASAGLRAWAAQRGCSSAAQLDRPKEAAIHNPGRHTASPVRHVALKTIVESRGKKEKSSFALNPAFFPIARLTFRLTESRNNLVPQKIIGGLALSSSLLRKW